MHYAYALLSSKPSNILLNPSGPAASKNHLLYINNNKIITHMVQAYLLMH